MLANTSADADMLDVCLRSEDVPFVCRNAQGWAGFREAMVAGVEGLAVTDVRVIGSGRHGFSMKPYKRLRAFNDTSDIDVVVVNSQIFDALWILLLQTAYPRLSSNRGIGGWDVPARAELYAGWLTPTAVRMDWKIIGQRAAPLVEFKQKWFGALKQAARYASKRHNDITGRLYRTWQHAELYHLFSVAELRRSLEA